MGFSHSCLQAEMQSREGGDAIIDTIYGKLSEMLERRHQIVHSADRIDILGQQDPVLVSVDPSMVEDWAEATQTLILIIITVASTAYGQQIIDRQDGEEK